MATKGLEHLKLVLQRIDQDREVLEKAAETISFIADTCIDSLEAMRVRLAGADLIEMVEIAQSIVPVRDMVERSQVVWAHIMSITTANDTWLEIVAETGDKPWSCDRDAAKAAAESQGITITDDFPTAIV